MTMTTHGSAAAAPPTDTFRNSEIVMMEESDAKNTNAYIDAFQRRRKTRIIAIATGALLVLGAAAVVVVATDKTADSANTSSSDQILPVSGGGAVNGAANDTIVGGIASYFTQSTLPPDNSTAALEHGTNPGSIDGTSNDEHQADTSAADSSSDSDSESARPNPSTTPVDNSITTTPAPTPSSAKTTPPVITVSPSDPPTTQPIVTSAPTPPPSRPTYPPTTNAPPPPPPTNPPTPPPAPITPPPSQPTPPPPSGSDLKAQIVRQTSIIRAGHGLGPVTWNQDLAGKMQAFADSCPQRSGGGHGGPPGSQNLAGFAECGNNCLRVPGPAQTWWDSEEELWDYDANKSKDGNWMTTGHFQNSLDPGVTQIACGWSTCFNPNVNKQDSLVWCNYVGGNSGRIPRPKMSKAQIRANIVA